MQRLAKLSTKNKFKYIFCQLSQSFNNIGIWAVYSMNIHMRLSDLMGYYTDFQLTHFRKQDKICYNGLTQHITKYYGLQLLDIIECLHSLFMSLHNMSPFDLFIDGNGNLLFHDFESSIITDNNENNVYIGNELYTPPEYFSDGIVGFYPNSDYWRFGVFLYQVTVGFPPFFHKNHSHLHKKIQHCSYRMPSFLNDDITDLINQV